MTWSYSGNPGSSAKDAVRFLIGDTDQCEQILQDGEITWVLSQYNNAPMNAAIRCCEAAVAKFTRLVDESVGSVSMSYSQRMKAFQELKATLVNRLATEDMTPFAGGISKAATQVVDANTDRVPPSFTRNMQQNWALSPWIMGGPGFTGWGYW